MLSDNLDDIVPVNTERGFTIHQEMDEVGAIKHIVTRQLSAWHRAAFRKRHVISRQFK